MIRRHPQTIYIVLLMIVVTLASAMPVTAKTTIKDEIEIGEKVASEIEKEFPVTSNKAWQADIEQLGKLLTPHVERKEIPYTFKIIKEEINGKQEIDAFSLPGGRVYFSERMWRLLTRDERIGVMAHEIAHIDKRHAIDTISENQKRSLWAIAIMIITGAGDGWWQAADLANSLYTLKYSRKREKEADLTAIKLVTAAGENPAGLVTAMKKIQRLEKEHGSGPPKILSTHPETKDRINYLTEECLAMGLKPEQLELRFEDRPDRIGQVTARAKEGMLITVAAIRKVEVNELVWIMKPLWDDEKGAVVPKPIARGVALTAGIQPEVSVKMEPGFEYVDIEKGDGVYPREPDPVPPPPEPEVQKTSVKKGGYYLDAK